MSNYKKIGSIAVGVIFLSIIVKSLAPTIYTIGLTIQQSGSFKLAGILFSVFIILVLLWLFMARSAIANKLFKDESDIEIDKSITFPQAVNLVCIFAGLIVLSDAIPLLLTGLPVFNLIKNLAVDEKITKHEINILQFELFFGSVLKFAIGLYLVCGAPHFVRWQIKRIKKLTEETIE